MRDNHQQFEISYWDDQTLSAALYSKGYAWCSRPPGDLVTEPLTTLHVRGYGTDFHRQIEGNWYLFYRHFYDGL
jgi:hypothetical protein